MTLFVCDITPLILIVPYPLAFGRIIRYTKGVYSCDFDTPSNTGGMLYSGLILMETPVLFAVLFYINLRILLIVRTRKNTPVGIEDATRNSRLKETNSLMRATIFQVRKKISLSVYVEQRT